MRYNTPKIGDIRKRSGFLWLPKEINHEVRFWEYAEWEEEYKWDPLLNGWEAYKWINKETNEVSN